MAATTLLAAAVRLLRAALRLSLGQTTGVTEDLDTALGTARREDNAWLLGHATLHRAELRLAGVTFMNSAGMAVLVQLQKLGRPRAVDVVLVGPPDAVARPLQLAGLWHRFPVVEEDNS